VAVCGASAGGDGDTPPQAALGEDAERAAAPRGATAISLARSACGTTDRAADFPVATGLEL
jgi:hypothetical protein